MASAPDTEPIYLSVADVGALHDEVLQRGGHPPAPLLNEAALESALMRPQTAAFYEGADIPRQAGLLAVAISQAQAFEEGNKRAAFAAMRTFLYVNGSDLAGDPLDVAERLTAVADRGAVTIWAPRSCWTDRAIQPMFWPSIRAS